MWSFWNWQFFWLVRVAVEWQDKAKSRIPWVPIRSSSPDTICRLHFQCVWYCQLWWSLLRTSGVLYWLVFSAWRLIINLLIEITSNVKSGGAKVKKYWCKKIAKNVEQKVFSICNLGRETDAISQVDIEDNKLPLVWESVYRSDERRKWPALDCGELDMPGEGELPRGSLSTPSVQTRQGWRTGGRCLMIWCLRLESGLARI